MKSLGLSSDTLVCIAGVLGYGVGVCFSLFLWGDTFYFAVSIVFEARN